MKVLVGVKRVIDYNVQVRVRADNTDVDLTHTKMAMNPFCGIAVEEAIRLKEKGVATEIVAVGGGPRAAQDQLRTSWLSRWRRSLRCRSTTTRICWPVHPQPVRTCYRESLLSWAFRSSPISLPWKRRTRSNVL